jgi:hypothetical protein
MNSNDRNELLNNENDYCSCCWKPIEMIDGYYKNNLKINYNENIYLIITWFNKISFYHLELQKILQRFYLGFSNCLFGLI